MGPEGTRAASSISTGLRSPTAQHERGHRVPLRLAWAFCFALLAWFLFAWGAAEFLIVNVDLPSADAIVVLGGSAAYVERTERAAQLFHEGRAPIDDGLRGAWSPERRDNPRYVDLAADELARRGVGTDRIRIVAEMAGGGTYPEAMRIRQYASTHRVKSILIVTSAHHSRRALWAMHRALNQSGIQVGIAVTEHTALHSLFWWLLPSGWRTVGDEYVKFAYYLIHYP